MTGRLTTAALAAAAVLMAAPLAAAMLMAAPVAIASADESAQETIADLQRQGYTVTSVRNPQMMTQWVPYVGPGLGSREGTFLVPVVTSQNITVSLDCTQR